MTLSGFLTIALLTLLGAISPGPAVLTSARTGLTEGMRSGAFLALGIGVGACIWALAALFGLNLVFQAAPIVLVLLKIGGAAFLIYVAWGLWQGASRPLAEAASEVLPRGPRAAFVKGVVTQLTNPKPAVVMSAIFLGTVPAGTPGWIYAAILGVILLNETAWNVIVVRIFSTEATRRAYLGFKSTIDRLFAAGLAGLAVKIAAT